MASPTTADPPLPPVKFDPLAALLSYIVPGLGQIYQGRVGKGLLFFGGLYLLFFYGMWMGQWRNVWLPDAEGLPDVAINGNTLGGVAKAVSYRPQFLGQFWIGTAAWPAVYQYAVYDRTKEAGPIFGTFQRTPPEGTPNDPPERITLNKLQREGNKRWDLGWVYTVIAGVLNLLVIYDAFAGPMFRDPPVQSATTATEAEGTQSATAAKPVPPAPPPPVPAEVPPPTPMAPVAAAPPPAPQQGGV